MFREIKGLAAVAAAAAVVIAAGPGAHAATSANLLRDPGGEAGGYGDWDTQSGFVFEQYGAENRPGTSVGASINGGANFFAGGSDSTVSTAVQTVDVSSNAAGIDAGTVTTALAGYLGGIDDESDYADVKAEFLPAADGPSLGTPVTIGPVTAADRNNQTKFLPRSATGSVPAGTRRIRVTVTSTRTDGIYTDGYADNLSLTLAGAAVATATPTTKPTVTPTATPTRAPAKVTKLKVKGKKVTGKVKASSGCKSGRKVILTKKSKTLARAKSKGSGKFTLKSKKAPKGKLKVTVKQRVLTGGRVCSATSKKVSAKR